MAFPSMSAFFVDQTSMEHLPNAPVDTAAIRHEFPYDPVSSGVEIRYHHNGEMTWNQPRGRDLRKLILVSRVPERLGSVGYYRLWVIARKQIAGVISDAGKITTGSLRAGLGISKNQEVNFKSKDIETYGAEYFEGDYDAVCNWLDGIMENDKRGV